MEDGGSEFGCPGPNGTKDTYLGKIRSFKSLSKLEIAFLCISLLSLLSALGITIYRIASVDHLSSDFTFGLVVVLNIAFCFYYILNGIFFERPYEIGVFVFATGLQLIYLVLNYAFSVRGMYKLIRLVVSSVSSLCLIFMGIGIARHYNKSNNLIFRNVGAITELQKICKTMFMFFGLLTADLQMSLSLALLIFTSPKHLSLVEIVLLPLMLLFGLSSFISGYASVRYENKCVAIVYATLWIVMPVFATCMIVATAIDLQSPAHDTKMEVSLYIMVFVVATGCWMVRLVSLYYGVKARRNFSKGLKEKVFPVTEELLPINAPAYSV